MEKVAAVEDPGLIHSDDGAFTVRLGVAITEPKEKVDGAHVAVIEATLVTPCEKTSASQHQDKKSLEVLEQTVTLCNLCQLRANARPAGMTLSSCQFFPEGRRLCLPGHCVSKPVEKHNEQEIIVKIFTIEYGSRQRGELEVAALKRLTAAECKYAPTYLGDFEKKLEGVEGGVVRYVLMTKLPGYALADNNAWSLTPFRINQVEKAFDVAIESVHRCAVDNRSPFLRNVMWSPTEEKCYIVDFERAELRLSPDQMPEEWSDFEWWGGHEDQAG